MTRRGQRSAKAIHRALVEGEPVDGAELDRLGPTSLAGLRATLLPHRAFPTTVLAREGAAPTHPAWWLDGRGLHLAHQHGISDHLITWGLRGGPRTLQDAGAVKGAGAEHLKGLVLDADGRRLGLTAACADRGKWVRAPLVLDLGSGRWTRGPAAGEDMRPAAWSAEGLVLVGRDRARLRAELWTVGASTLRPIAASPQLAATTGTCVWREGKKLVFQRPGTDEPLGRVAYPFEPGASRQTLAAAWGGRAVVGSARTTTRPDAAERFVLVGVAGELGGTDVPTGVPGGELFPAPSGWVVALVQRTAPAITFFDLRTGDRREVILPAPHRAVDAAWAPSGRALAVTACGGHVVVIEDTTGSIDAPRRRALS